MAGTGTAGLELSCATIHEHLPTNIEDLELEPPKTLSLGSNSMYLGNGDTQ